MVELTQASKLEGDTLDHFVAVALGWKIVMWGDKAVWVQASGEGRFRCNVADWHPSTNPAQAWPIIESERIHIRPNSSDKNFKAFVVISPTGMAHRNDGTSSIIAAMRCFVASKLGSEFVSLL